MGNTPDCCDRDEIIDNIIEERNEIFGYSPEDDKIPDDASFISNHGGEYPIESEYPANFKYEAKYPNLVNKEKIIIQNLPPQKIMEYDNDQEELDQDLKYQEKQNVFDMNNVQKGQLMRIKQLFDLCYRNGRPRPCDDFDHNMYTMFYPKNDNYFYVDRTGVYPNRLKIYNKDDMNHIQIYQGDLNSQGQRHGLGKCTTPYYVLIGQWKNDKFSGWGRESRSNGDVFEGRYENGLLNGKGIFLNEKKCKYVGDFLYTKRWGKGELTTDKIHYKGDFYNNQIHGNGRIKFLREGVEYMGSFKGDKIDGYGVFKWKNGDRYEGQVRSGRMHGFGKYKYSNGKEYNGIFNNGDKASDKMKKYEIWKKNGYGVSAYSQNLNNLRQNSELENNIDIQNSRAGTNSQNQFQDNVRSQHSGSGSNGQGQLQDNLMNQKTIISDYRKNGFDGNDNNPSGANEISVPGAALESSNV